MSRQQVEGYFFCLYAPMGKFFIFIKRTRNLPEDNSVAQIICKNWENVWNGNQPWDREIAGNSIPEKAVLIDRPDDIIRASRLFPLGAVDFCNIAFQICPVHSASSSSASREKLTERR